MWTPRQTALLWSYLSQANTDYICTMPGYHKKYQNGKNNPLFFQTLPSQTPKQVKEENIRKKIDEVYGKGFQPPYDDDAPPPKGMRLVKENLTGRQMNIAKQAAPKDRITGADFTALQEKKKKLREMLMGRGKADAKVYQGGAGDMDAEDTNFLLNPEAGFQEGDIGRLGGTTGRPEQLPTFQDYFEKQYGYFPTVGTLPTTEQGAYRGSDLRGAPENVFYSDLTEKTSDEGLFRGSVDRGSGAFPTAGGRYETVEDFRDYQPGSSFQGVSFFRKGAGDEELRAAYRTKKDVEEASKRYAELMRKAKLSPKKSVTMEAIDPEREGESGGFRVSGPASEVNKTMGAKLMTRGLYIR